MAAGTPRTLRLDGRVLSRPAALRLGGCVRTHCSSQASCCRLSGMIIVAADVILVVDGAVEAGADLQGVKV